jgi:two-component system, cell cycle response regulator DivK
LDIRHEKTIYKKTEIMGEITKKILIAEDNEINYRLIEEYLNNETLEIIWAKNGREAIDLYLENKDIDIILMDIQMPVMNGIDAAKEIKKIDSNIPIIAISAYNEISLIETDIDAYIQKPFLPDKLFVVIEEYMKKIYDEILKKEEERQKKWVENEKETLRVLSGVAELLEMTDRVNKAETENVMKKLGEIKDILNKKIID